MKKYQEKVTVRELIEKLSKCNSDKFVRIEGSQLFIEHVFDVLEDDSVVWVLSDRYNNPERLKKFRG
jgi:hypothetical protein